MLFWSRSPPVKTSARSAVSEAESEGLGFVVVGDMSVEVEALPDVDDDGSVLLVVEGSGDVVVADALGGS